MERMNLGSHKGCIVLTSGDFRIVVTTHVGPRVIGGFIGDSDNLFAVLPDKPMPGIGTGFILYGGHRLWHSPEAAPRTYAPDNAPVELTTLADGAVAFSSGVEALTGIAKSIAIKPLPGNRFQLTHRLENRNQWAVELAPWALSQMAPGGCAVIPQGRVAGANPFAVDRTLHLWPYADLSDPRLVFTSNYILLRQCRETSAPCKIGYRCRDGWIAYVNGGTALVKHIACDPAVTYPDHGCNVESYTCDTFLEIETLGALTRLEPGAAIEHVEVWQGLAGVGKVTDEASIVAQLAGRVSRTD